MAITSLSITDFRNLAFAELNPFSRGLNVICGDNGSGKTSLLEAIHYLGLGRSFRTATSSRLIRKETEKFSLFAQLLRNNLSALPIGVERHVNGDTRLRMDEKDVSSISDLAYFLPLRLINSQSHHLFESGPMFRRKYLDWGLFYQTERFLPCWRHFGRALKQRNAVLKDRRSKQELDVWTDELVKYGIEFDQLRAAYVKELAPKVEEIARELLSISHLTLEYHSGWDKNRDFAAVLAGSYHDDCRFGYTQAGPHRADFDVTIDGKSVKHFLSRGQQKLLICAMMLAQGMGVGERGNELIYLVDDLPSELDLPNKQKLISLLSKQPAQVFITAIQHEEICSVVDEKSKVPLKVFHVEHGSVAEL
jgi:DNA replication and repair protein RecF